MDYISRRKTVFLQRGTFYSHWTGMASPVTKLLPILPDRRRPSPIRSKARKWKLSRIVQDCQTIVEREGLADETEVGSPTRPNGPDFVRE